MDIDVAALVGAVTRRLEGREHNGRPAWLLTATRTYPTTIDDLWDAVTNPERIPRWFLPVSGDLQVGGRYQLEGNAGGEVLACEPPRRFEVTWEFGGDTTWLTVELRPAATLPAADGEATELELRHLAHVPEELWREYGPGATGIGWELGLLGLQLHLTTGAAVDPGAFMAWSSSAEGVGLVSQVSDAWAAASVAAGTETAVAAAAADRVTAFYTVVPDTSPDPTTADAPGAERGPGPEPGGGGQTPDHPDHPGR